MAGYVLAALGGAVLSIALLVLWQNRKLRSGSQATGTSSSAQADDGSADLLATPPTLPPPSALRRWLTPRIVAAAVAVAALAVIGLAVFRQGSNESTAPALVSAGGDQALDDVDTMIQRLEARLGKDPTDGEGFRMLGWSYMMTGRAQQSLDPFRKALALLPQQANVHAGYGEALVSVAGGTVTDEAKSEFDRALALDPAEPRARYFAALFQAQHGDRKGALEQWIALANSASPDAPWQAEVREKISEVSQALGVDVSTRLTAATPSARSAEVAAPAGGAGAGIGALSGRFVEGDRQAMVTQMVDGLAERLKRNSRDVDGWTKLLRSRMVLQQGDQAARDLASARAALAEDRPALDRLEGEARDLGVPGAR